MFFKKGKEYNNPCIFYLKYNADKLACIAIKKTKLIK